jgi:hypothetical protein
MSAIERKSPVSFSARPVAVEESQGWKVAVEYEGEGGGPWLVDLSHCEKWDFQDPGIARMSPFGVHAPDAPNKSALSGGILINRMNKVQVSIWHLRRGASAFPEGPGYTETTEVQVLLALVGKDVFSITEKLTSLNLEEKGRTAPFLVQGPFSHVPCQIVVLERNGMDGTVLVACSRGYAHDMAHGVLHAGKEFGLRPGGENVFLKCLPAGKQKPVKKGAR